MAWPKKFILGLQKKSGNWYLRASQMHHLWVECFGIMSITICVRKKSLNPVTGHILSKKNDIKNHVYLAKQALQLSKLDQKNLELKATEMEIRTSRSNIIFRPSKLKEGTNEEKKHALKPGCYTGVSTTCESETAEDENNFEDTLLWIHQEKWQRELLTKYGMTSAS